LKIWWVWKKNVSLLYKIRMVRKSLSGGAYKKGEGKYMLANVTTARGKPVKSANDTELITEYDARNLGLAAVPPTTKRFKHTSVVPANNEVMVDSFKMTNPDMGFQSFASGEGLTGFGEKFGDMNEMVYCTSPAQCQQYAKSDIVEELGRRGVAVNNLHTKPVLIRKLLATNKMFLAQMRMMGASGAGFQGGFPSSATNPSMYYLGPRDFGLGKQEYIDILKAPTGSHTNAAGNIIDNAAIIKDIGERTGLIKEKYLTIDHAGLEMTNSAGSKFKVIYDPITDNASWKKVAGARWEDIPQQLYLIGHFKLGKDGLPVIGQLSYESHHLFVHRDRNGRIMQVRCHMKDLNKGEEPGNCKTDKNGKILLRWAPYDPTVKILSTGIGQKFTTPLGVFTFDQLMTMPMDKIVQMLVILKIAEESTSGGWGDKLSKYGIKFDPRTGKLNTTETYVPAIETFGGKRIAPIRTSTRLPPWFLQAEEKVYRSLDPNVKKECTGRKSVRCHVDSYAPGVCSPSTTLCYDPNILEYYKAGGKAQRIRDAVSGTSYPIFNQAVTRLMADDPMTDTEIDKQLQHYKYSTKYSPSIAAGIGALGPGGIGPVGPTAAVPAVNPGNLVYSP